jgi:hypothetical protein
LISVFGKRESYESNGFGYQSIIEQANKSLNLTSPALRGGQRSGAVKRAPQVSSSPLGGEKKVVNSILTVAIWTR